MNDRTSNFTNYDELKFAREQGFFDKSPSIRLFIGIIFTVALFFFLHFREIRVEVLELNSTSPGYVVSQIDFDFIDEEATAILKQDAIRDIGKIFKLQEKEVRQRRIEFENFLIYNQEWRKSANDTTFDEMYRGVDLLEKFLLEIKFSDPRTLQIMKRVGIPTSHYLIYTPSDVSEPVILPAQIWQYLLEKMLNTKELHKSSTSLIIQFFQNRNWMVDEDAVAQDALRRRIQSQIPEKMTHVSAGSRIIDQGERVTARHIAMLQAMKTALRENRNLWHPLTLLGSFLLSLLLVSICIVYFNSNHPQILRSNRKLSLIVTIVILTLAIAKATELFLLTSQSHIIEVIRYPTFVPFAAILLCSLMNLRIATFASGFLTLLMTLVLAFEPQGFMVINIATALVAILSARSMRRRQEIFVICAKAWLCGVLVIFALQLSQNTLWNFNLAADILTVGVSLLLTAVAVIGLLPLLESFFRVMTDVTLTEYMDPNNDLLRRLTIEAPGTYQHSVVVGNIAETAALAIGANGLFCRVATLYHDIGKMATPQYFTENQHGGVDVHQLLTPQESAQVIIAHVSEGVSMGRKAGLPEQFIDMIKEHHGTTLVYYFYRKQLEKMHGDKSKVSESDFRYAGPKPRSKESAIIMIADTLEAASRSLEKITEEALTELATRLVREKVEDGQFDHCLLTLEELSLVTSSLIKTLVAFGHSRVKYPVKEQRKDIRAPSLIT